MLRIAVSQYSAASIQRPVLMHLTLAAPRLGAPAGSVSPRGIRLLAVEYSSTKREARTAYNLQYHHNAKYFVRSVATDEVGRFEQATENYRRFMDLVQKYIDEESERGIREIRKEVERERRKAAKAE